MTDSHTDNSAPERRARDTELLAENERLRAEVLAENRKSFARGVQLDDANRQLSDLLEESELLRSGAVSSQDIIDELEQKNDQHTADLKEADTAVLKAAAEMGELRAQIEKQDQYLRWTAKPAKERAEIVDSLRAQLDDANRQLAELRGAAHVLRVALEAAEGNAIPSYVWRSLDKVRAALAGTKEGK